jgi:Tol biopolymer transport system component/DNA-binding winged helix-turn-helix (wHTH) protein
MLIGGQATGMNAAFRIRSEETRFLAVGEHVVDVDTLRLVTSPGAPRLTPKAAAVLLQLVRAAGRTLSRDELLNEVWKGTCPTPDVLTQAVKDLRRLLGDDLHAPRFVETLPRLGYRLVAPARFIDDSTASAFAPGVHADDAKSPKAPPAHRARRWILGAVAAATIATLALGLRREQGDSAELKPRWHASAQRTITADPGPERYPRISPDGTRVAYSIVDPVRHASRIVQRSLVQSRLIDVTNGVAGNEFFPVWSPDGASIAFARQDSNDGCSVLLASALGGAERLIDRCVVASVTYFSWTPDGRSLIATRPSSATATDMAITLVPIDGSALDRIPYHHDNTDLDLDARYSPDGRLIAFRRGASPYSDLFLVDAIGGEVRQLTHLASRMRGFDWTRDGSALVFSSSHEGPQELYTVSIGDGRIESLGVQPAEFPSAARGSDTVVYEIPRLRTQLATVALGGDADSAPQALVPSTGNDGAPTFSPVDDRVAFVSDRSGTQQVWLADPASGETSALTESDEPTLRYPVWRSDGQRILITARGTAIGSLIEIDIATRTQRVLTAPDEDIRYGVYGPRPGSYVAVVGGSGEGRELIQFENDNGTETSRLVLARDVARIDYDRTDATVYFTKVSEAGLFKVDQKSGNETLVTRRINPAHLDGWLVLGGHVFYIEAKAKGPSRVHELDPVSGDDEVVASIPDSVADFNFSVSHDRREIVIVRVAAEDTDVGAVTLTHEGAG